MPVLTPSETSDLLAIVGPGGMAGLAAEESGRRTREPGEPGHTAVIDVGSGSARAVVMQVNPGGGVEILAQQRINLDLMSLVDDSGLLAESGVANTMDALEDFALVARGFGVGTIHAVATEALRASGNASAIMDAAVERLGLPLRIIGGDEEAAYCFLGAIHGLPVSDGLLADIGGGSVEIVQFRDRALRSSVSLPLGSLRTANRFRLTDLPTADDARAAYHHVQSALAEAGIPRLANGEALVASGGSARLLSRLDRNREPYPIIKMHGYEIGAGNLADQSRGLAAVSYHQRMAMDGMNPERAHSIVGGAIVAHALAQYVHADSLLVSGQGLREGLARHPWPLAGDCDISVPPLDRVRMASLVDLARRFVPRFSSRGNRRAMLASNLGAILWDPCDDHVSRALSCAAFLLDIGNAVDFYNRLNRTASIIVRTDLPGFTHRESAYIAAILLASERTRLPPRFLRSRLLDKHDLHLIQQAGVALGLIDELDVRLAPEYPADAVRFDRQNGMFRVVTPAWSRAAIASISEIWKATFGDHIEIERCEL